MIACETARGPISAFPSTTTARRGVTMIETLVLISILAFVLGAAAIQIQLLLKLDQDGRARIDLSTAWERLGRQIRHDVHEAEAVEVFVEKQGVGLRIKGRGNPPRLVEYRSDRTGVVRVESVGNQSVVRELYAIPGMLSARFERRAESDRPFVALVVTRSVARQKDVPPRVDEILAAVRPNETVEPSNPKGVK